jgi:hypothetical protein
MNPIASSKIAPYRRAGALTSTASLQHITTRDPKEAPGWLDTVVANQRHITARATQGYQNRLRYAEHRYRTNQRQTDNKRLEEHVAEAPPPVATGRPMRGRCEHVPIQTLVSIEESFL